MTKSLQAVGFGVLTRIDMHAKIKEKIGKDMPRLAIPCACNPTLAYEAFSTNPGVASLLPCNAVVREVRPGIVSIECAKPSSRMKILGDHALEKLATQTDTCLAQALVAVVNGCAKSRTGSSARQLAHSHFPSPAES